MDEKTTRPRAAASARGKARRRLRREKMSRIKHAHHDYMGCVITRNDAPGHRLRWSALTPGGSVAADTLAGVKALIRDKAGKR